MNKDFLKDYQGPVYDDEVCINLAMEKTDLPREIVEAILDAEYEYMKSIGMVVDLDNI